MSSHLERRFALLWKAHGGPLPLKHEVKFHPTRKWRFDFAHAGSKVAIEIEGGTWARGAHSRGKGYGAPEPSHANIGLAWTGLIQQHYGIQLDHPLPAWLVALMMVQFKASRAARVFHADNFVDLAAYAKFAEEFQSGPKGYQPMDPGTTTWKNPDGSVVTENWVDTVKRLEEERKV